LFGYVNLVMEPFVSLKKKSVTNSSMALVKTQNKYQTFPNLKKTTDIATYLLIEVGQDKPRTSGVLVGCIPVIAF